MSILRPPPHANKQLAHHLPLPQTLQFIHSLGVVHGDVKPGAPRSHPPPGPRAAVPSMHEATMHVHALQRLRSTKLSWHRSYPHSQTQQHPPYLVWPHPTRPENIVAAASADASQAGGRARPGPGAPSSTAPFFLVDFGGASFVNGGSCCSGCHRPQGDAESEAPARRQPWITPNYASAAALRGAAPDPADDVEALLAVLLWLATGQLPW
jgi:serine/threonine protein kinase